MQLCQGFAYNKIHFDAQNKFKRFEIFRYFSTLYNWYLSKSTGPLWWSKGQQYSCHLGTLMVQVQILLAFEYLEFNIT